ncbi:protein phosphatase 1 regulatory subunit 3A [Gouania willdenowi]|uniref:protein phosphatase 1 regulatory subunit 3A n=1 Tax=Gouania willdenowi TaxID=441366 RepID=UPI001054FD79|nr:protein phosphatase 1 regulatory subunit 3A-like [Gouania willdenowi]
MELVGKLSPYQANQLLGVPALSLLDEDDEDSEVVIGIRPKSSPLPRRRSSSTEEDLDFEPPLSGSRRVSFADAKGLSLVQVKEFGLWDIPKLPGYESSDNEGSDAEEFFISPLTFSLPWSTEELLTRVREKKVELETLEILPGTTIVRGVIRVLNISFNKAVYIRTSLDSWSSHFDLLAEYIPGSSDCGTDCFSFKLTLGPPYGIKGAKVDFCLRYETSAGIFWANNDNKNYVLRCQHRIRTKKEKAHGSKRSCLKTSSLNFSTVVPTTNESSRGESSKDVFNHGLTISKAISYGPSKTSEEHEQKAQMETRLNSSRSGRKTDQLAQVMDYFAQRTGGNKEESPAELNHVDEKCTDVPSENSQIISEAPETHNPSPAHVCSSDSELAKPETVLKTGGGRASDIDDSPSDQERMNTKAVKSCQNPYRAEEDEKSSAEIDQTFGTVVDPLFQQVFERKEGGHQSLKEGPNEDLHSNIGQKPKSCSTLTESRDNYFKAKEYLNAVPESPAGEEDTGSTKESTRRGGDKDDGDQDEGSKELISDSPSKEEHMIYNHTDTVGKETENNFDSCSECEQKSCEEFICQRENPRVNTDDFKFTAAANISEDDNTCLGIKDEDTGKVVGFKQNASNCLLDLTKNWEMMVEEEETNILMSNQEGEPVDLKKENTTVTEEGAENKERKEEHVQGSAKDSHSDHKERVESEFVVESRAGIEIEVVPRCGQETKQRAGEEKPERDIPKNPETEIQSSEVDEVISKTLHVPEEVQIELKDEGHVGFQWEGVRKEEKQENPDCNFDTVDADSRITIEDGEYEEAYPEEKCPRNGVDDDTSALDHEQQRVSNAKNTHIQNEEEVQSCIYATDDQPNMESKCPTLDEEMFPEQSYHTSQEGSSAESDSDDEVELYMHCLRAVSTVERSSDTSVTVARRTSITRSKLQATPMPPISESVDEEQHFTALKEEHQQVCTDSTIAQAASSRHESSETDTFPCINVSKTLVCTSLLVLFFVVAYHYDFLACFGLYLISVVWLCCQEEKQGTKEHK